jgi:hypothetical protein
MAGWLGFDAGPPLLIPIVARANFEISRTRRCHLPIVSCINENYQYTYLIPYASSTASLKFTVEEEWMSLIYDISDLLQSHSLKLKNLTETCYS